MASKGDSHFQEMKYMYQCLEVIFLKSSFDGKFTKEVW